MLSIARQFGSVAKAADVAAPSAKAMKSAAVRVPVSVFMLNLSFRLTCPRRALADPSRKSIPFGPTHPALLVSDPDENKGRIVPSRFRTNKNCRDSIGVPDNCCVCHVRLLSGAESWLEHAAAIRGPTAIERRPQRSPVEGRLAPITVVRATHEYRICRDRTSDRLLSSGGGSAMLSVTDRCH